MKKKYYFQIFFAALALSCTVSKHHNGKDFLQGVFVQKEAREIELHFKNEKYVLLNTHQNQGLSVYCCCDTISQGTWSLDTKTFLALTSKNSKSLLDVAVIEAQNFSKDSIYFFIENPIEDYLRNTKNNREQYVAYRIEMYSNRPEYDEKFWNMKFTTNPIAFAKTNDVSVGNFDVSIFIDPEICLKNVENFHFKTIPYGVRDSRSNVFYLRMPDFNFERISHKNLNADYVKILSKHKLIWDGKLYVRK